MKYFVGSVPFPIPR